MSEPANNTYFEYVHFNCDHKGDFMIRVEINLTEEDLKRFISEMIPNNDHVDNVERTGKYIWIRNPPTADKTLLQFKFSENIDALKRNFRLLTIHCIDVENLLEAVKYCILID
jgi:hypothetical protein